MGKLGTAISNMAKNITDIEIVAGFDEFHTKMRAYPIYGGINEITEAADVLISVLPPTAADETLTLLNYGVAKQMPMVICTTAIPAHIESAIAEASKKTAVIKSPNMSLGISLLENILSRAAKLLYNSNFDIEIIEKHHNKKLDAPSGTAVRMAQAINDALDQDMRIVTDRSEEQKERDRNEIGVSAVRGGNIIGEHSVIFAGQNETIEIKHTAHSRDVFAEGALKAAKFIRRMPPGLYDMQDLINKV
jgi:4-hydroxy-tetrahydrodipicolinate reductase